MSKPQSKEGTLLAHASARLTPRGQWLLVQRVWAGWTITKAAEAAGISRQTGSKWGRWVPVRGRARPPGPLAPHAPSATAHPAALVERSCSRASSSAQSRLRLGSQSEAQRPQPSLARGQDPPVRRVAKPGRRASGVGRMAIAQLSAVPGLTKPVKLNSHVSKEPTRAAV